jgi:protein tyrosine/serine phosphatase
MAIATGIRREIYPKNFGKRVGADSRGGSAPHRLVSGVLLASAPTFLQTRGKMKTGLLTILLMGLIIIPSGCTTTNRGFNNPIDNFDKVDDKVLRGAQPNVIGLGNLKAEGVTDIVCLREEDYWQKEPALCADLGIEFHHIPLNPMRAPAQETVKEVLKVIKNAKGKVFIHCQFGCDRTGVVVAIYRIVNGEKNKVALDDAMKHGMSSWEIGMQELIKHAKPENFTE